MLITGNSYSYVIIYEISNTESSRKWVQLECLSSQVPVWSQERWPWCRLHTGTWSPPSQTGTAVSGCGYRNRSETQQIVRAFIASSWKYESNFNPMLIYLICCLNILTYLLHQKERWNAIIVINVAFYLLFFSLSKTHSKHTSLNTKIIIILSWSQLNSKTRINWQAITHLCIPA